MNIRPAKMGMQYRITDFPARKPSFRRLVCSGLFLFASGLTHAGSAYLAQYKIEHPQQNSYLRPVESGRKFYQAELDRYLEMGKGYIEEYNRTGSSSIDPGYFFLAAEYYAQRLTDANQVYLMPKEPLAELVGLFERDVERFRAIVQLPHISREDKLDALVNFVHSKSPYDGDAFLLPSLLMEGGAQQCHTRAKYMRALLSRFPEFLGPDERLVYGITHGATEANDGHIVLGIYNGREKTFLSFDLVDKKPTKEWKEDLYDMHIDVQVMLDYFDKSLPPGTDYDKRYQKLLVAKATVRDELACSAQKGQHKDIAKALRFQPKISAPRVVSSGDQDVPKEQELVYDEYFDEFGLMKGPIIRALLAQGYLKSKTGGKKWFALGENFDRKRENFNLRGLKLSYDEKNRIFNILKVSEYPRKVKLSLDDARKSLAVLKSAAAYASRMPDAELVELIYPHLLVLCRCHGDEYNSLSLTPVEYEAVLEGLSSVEGGRALHRAAVSYHGIASMLSENFDALLRYVENQFVGNLNEATRAIFKRNNIMDLKSPRYPTEYPGIGYNRLLYKIARADRILLAGEEEDREPESKTKKQNLSAPIVAQKGFFEIDDIIFEGKAGEAASETVESVDINYFMDKLFIHPNVSLAFLAKLNDQDAAEVEKRLVQMIARRGRLPIRIDGPYLWEGFLLPSAANRPSLERFLNSSSGAKREVMLFYLYAFYANTLVSVGLNYQNGAWIFSPGAVTDRLTFEKLQPYMSLDSHDPLLREAKTVYVKLAGEMPKKVSLVSY